MAQTKVTPAELALSKTVDANGWTVYDYGAFKEYTREVANASYATPVGDNDLDLASIAPPVDITPNSSEAEIIFKKLWTNTSWSFVVKGCDSYMAGGTLRVRGHVSNSAGVTNNLSFVIQLRITR